MTLEKEKTEPPKRERDKKNKFSETLDSIKNSDQVDSVVTYAQNNTLDTIAYAIVLLGLILMFWNHFIGGLLVGVVAGFYFSAEILELFRNTNAKIERNGLARSIVFAGVLIALLLFLPGLVIGAAIAAVLSLLLKK